jgi:hypothetical protein
MQLLDRANEGGAVMSAKTSHQRGFPQHEILRREVGGCSLSIVGGVLSLSGLLMVLPALSNWGDLILGRECARRGIGVVFGGACNPMTFLGFPTSG